MAQIACEILWLRLLIHELGFSIDKPKNMFVKTKQIFVLKVILYFMKNKVYQTRNHFCSRCSDEEVGF